MCNSLRKFRLELTRCLIAFFIAGTGSEEVSVFNGDENHKVWAGKTPEPPAEGIYDYGSTLRSFRSTVSGTSHRNRPRQMLMPSSPPPPPIPEEKEESHSPKKDKKKKKRSKSRDNLDSSALTHFKEIESAIEILGWKEL